MDHFSAYFVFVSFGRTMKLKWYCTLVTEVLDICEKYVKWKLHILRFSLQHGSWWKSLCFYVK